jgi:hypothetical protein
MKRFLKSRLVLVLTAFIMIAAAIAIPLSGNIAHSHATAPTPGPNTLPTSGPDALYQINETGWSGFSQTSDTVNGWGDDQWQITLSSTRSVSIQVIDCCIVGDNYEVYVDSKLIGTTPPEPLYGSTDSQGTFTTTLTAGSHLITIRDPGGISYYQQGDTFMIPAGYSVTITTSLACSKGPTGLDTCQLQKGDILLEAANDIVSHSVGGFVSSYWFHTAMYDGSGNVLEAAGPDLGLRCYPIQQTQFYDGASDWVVLRVKPQYQSDIDEAVRLTKTMTGSCPGETPVASPSAGYMPVPEFLNPLNKSNALGYGDNCTTATCKFYCSLLTWWGFKKADSNLDLDFPQAYLNPTLGPTAAALLNQVLGDNIYASSFGPFAETDEVMNQNPLWKRLLITLFSPADLKVTDPSGNITGLDFQTGNALHAIPYSYYSGAATEPEWISIGNTQGTQTIQVKGTGTGVYHLAIQEFTNATAPMQDQVFTWETTPGQIDTFAESSSPDGKITLNPLQLTVPVDIKPGSSTNPIYLKSQGVIPVAILSTSVFDATTVDPLTVQFGPNGAVASSNPWHLEDVNGDGKLDMVLQFNTQQTGIRSTDTQACLTGKTKSGVPIKGCDVVSIVK